jgi:hypothetical protein
MKNSVLFLISGIFMFSVSCLNDPYDEMLDISDSDILAVSDSTDDMVNDSNYQVDDNSVKNDEDQTTTNPDTEIKDEETLVDNETSDEDSSIAECGNGVVETGEICDKNTIACKDLDASFTGGDATCQEGCRGWNVDSCEGGNTATPLAEMPAATFKVEYLYNGVADFNIGANQDNELWNAPLFSASIPLTTGSYTIPHYLADAHWLTGFFDSQSIQFVQQSYVFDTGQLTLPYIVMGAGISDAVAGAELSIGIKNENEVNFIVQDMMNDVDCIILVGYGTLTVNTINLTPGPAGEFSFTTSKIGLYLPAQTPEGDMTSEIESSGFTICK